ncbi:hypothetical protein CBM2613_A110006 [Cupriavidus taiwanensis]|uniref:Uncharacterized protein n=1 Tax=Cupriavidus taiwanensis TaxID=164546 RepID=A0A976ASP6_9BURK|nr:hypothetical protein CBM2613_A110006 [Cupriavidus taiwanensis]
MTPGLTPSCGQFIPAFPSLPQKAKTREALSYRGFPDVARCRWTECWWSRRESNPRPQALHREFYILSSVI